MNNEDGEETKKRVITMSVEAVESVEGPDDAVIVGVEESAMLL